jgi:hypothetical protein
MKSFVITAALLSAVGALAFMGTVGSTARCMVNEGKAATRLAMLSTRARSALLTRAMVAAHPARRW